MSLLSRLYGLASGTFHELHDTSLASSRRASIPVLSIGNLVAGGTGKTVLVDWVLKRLGPDAGVACRGYRADADGSNDEMKVLQRLNPGLRIEADVERFEAVQRLARAGCRVAVLDDGFQHRRLERDLDWVILDATDPFSSGPLPGGLRREPIANLARADLVWLSHADRLDPADRESLRRRVQAVAGCPVLAAGHRMSRPVAADGSVLPTQPVHLVAGVGQPRHVVSGLEEAGYPVVRTTFPGDHRRPSPEEIGDLARSALPVVCTLKDAVKIPESVSWWTVGVEWRPMDICLDARRQLDRLLPR